MRNLALIGNKRRFGLGALAAGSIALAAGLAVGCGGGAASTGDSTVETGSRPAAGPTVLGPSDPGGNIQAVPGSNVFAIATATPAPGLDATPTPTPPPVTIGETQTSVLVDELSFEEYPRWPARELESLFRNEPARAQTMLGKGAVIRSQVRESGRDGSGSAFVTLAAGGGAVTCWFKEITEAELRRLAPGGNNSVVGTLSEWDATKRQLTVRDCRLVRGY